MKGVLERADRLGSAGALVMAVAAPCCFPLFATVSTALGLSVLAEYESIILYLFQGLALLSLLGLRFALFRHRNLRPLLLGIASCAAIGYHFYFAFSLMALYLGLFGLIAASGWNYFALRARVRKQPLLQSIITCPECGHSGEETMPTNACLYFYDCPWCGARLKPKEGDCCVFCSYGSVPCPPIQVGEECCV